MVTFFETFMDWFKDILGVAAPVIIIVFTLALLTGLAKWSHRAKEWIKTVASNPILFVIWVALSLIGIFFFYKYGLPLLRQA